MIRETDTKNLSFLLLFPEDLHWETQNQLLLQWTLTNGCLMNTVLHNKLRIVTANKDQHLRDSKPQQHFLPHTYRMS